MRVARLGQLALVALIVAAALLIGPSDRGVASEPTLPNQDARVAAFADDAANALASLQGQPLDAGFEGTDRGGLFQRGGPNYSQQSIAEVLVAAGMLDANEAEELAASGIRMLAVQCQDRVSVLATSDVEVPAERRMWWDDNRCDTELAWFLTWPVYVALSDDPDGGP